MRRFIAFPVTLRATDVRASSPASGVLPVMAPALSARLLLSLSAIEHSNRVLKELLHLAAKSHRSSSRVQHVQCRLVRFACFLEARCAVLVCCPCPQRVDEIVPGDRPRKWGFFRAQNLERGPIGVRCLCETVGRLLLLR